MKGMCCCVSAVLVTDSLLGHCASSSGVTLCHIPEEPESLVALLWAPQITQYTGWLQSK